MNIPDDALFVHCPDCLREDLPANIAVVLHATGTHVAVCCETHNKVIFCRELKRPMKNLKCAECGQIGQHIHHH